MVESGDFFGVDWLGRWRWFDYVSGWCDVICLSYFVIGIGSLVRGGVGEGCRLLKIFFVGKVVLMKIYCDGMCGVLYWINYGCMVVWVSWVVVVNLEI